MRVGIELPGELRAVQAHLGRALERVSRRFDDQLACDLPPVRALCEHVERYRGKMLRPTLVLACGLATQPDGADAQLTDDHITLAAVCEMVHMATLVHDDVLDEADTRRRGATVNRLRGNEAAVILGDYLIASAFHLCSQTRSQEPSLVVGRASMDMAAGELLQLHNREDYSIDEATYFEIVRRKTGALIAAACRLGALASGASAALCEAFSCFGQSLGVAFQIQDDLLDLTGRQGVVGKNVGKDAEKGKLTLPVIHHLAECSVRQRAETLSILSRLAQGEHSGTGEQLVQALDSTGSLERARQEAVRLVREARECLAGLAISPARQLIELMAESAVDRAF
ncbi:MAG: polyprenyl synthetase family protein [Leptolyngbya sp. PLA3]|nr:MAG: polyprenyl synthetase family protein [Cyanobacteria bacterium CYA]MCE7968844.1 polyprenyl synthetase family protein [Leptolyngbya sp. PL-A3]